MLDRRALMGLGLATSAAGLAACTAPGAPVVTTPSTASGSTSAAASSTSTSAKPSQTTPAATASDGAWGEPDVKLGDPIGDGSQAPSPDPQPFQREIKKLAKGEKPPQFVVFSWDGVSGDENRVQAYIKAAHEVQGTQTMFLSGLYFLPQSKKTEYHPPKRKPGVSDIPYMSDLTVRRTIENAAMAWKYGNEMGTHFNGHFDGGAKTWTSDDWEVELKEAIKLVTHWRTNTGWTDIDPLPFDYTKELVGARTPLLAGAATLMPIAKKHGFRYDSSGVRKKGWPVKNSYGIYDMSMFAVPFRTGSSLPMDYNYYFTQAGGKNTGTPAQRATWQAEHLDSLRAGLKMCMSTNRAPLIIGNHLSPWLGGIYQQNLLKLMTEFGKTPGVQLVSFRWLCDWLDAQDPEVLADLQKS